MTTFRRRYRMVGDYPPTHVEPGRLPNRETFVSDPPDYTPVQHIQIPLSELGKPPRSWLTVPGVPLAWRTHGLRLFMIRDRSQGFGPMAVGHRGSVGPRRVPHRGLPDPGELGFTPKVWGPGRYARKEINMQTRPGPYGEMGPSW